MKHIAILGSTGSIGQSTLEVIAGLPDEFKVVALSTNSNIDILHRQIRRFVPEVVAVANAQSARALEGRLSGGVKLLGGEDALLQLLEHRHIDLVVLAISGSAALLPLIKSIEEGRDVALANKEALVMAGDIVTKKAKKKKVKILPIDSEQSAIWQCIDGKKKDTLKKIYLTASGGPLRDLSLAQIKRISLRRVLKHPRWKMGKKITVDSATLMNKGLELIESMLLFDLDIGEIEIVIHPEAVIHSMAEFIDGSILAQLSVTDMRIPIQYALSYPARYPNSLAPLDFFRLKSLSFYKPDFNKFPCLGLSFEAARRAGSLPCVLNASNEVAVEAFLKGRISFLSIPKIIEKVLASHRVILQPKLEDIFRTDSWARQKAEEFTCRFARG